MPETFTMLADRWDIDKARAVLDQSPREPIQVPIASALQIIGLIRIDEVHAQTVDLSAPIIVALTPDGLPLPIDGWHRIWRASVEGYMTLPAYVLTLKESERVYSGARRYRTKLPD